MLQGEEDVAAWLVARPSAIRRAITTLQTVMGCAFDTRAPTEAEMLRVAALMPGDVVVFRQGHGDIVTIPPAFGHAVVNLAGNAKVATEVVHGDELHLYALAWGSIGTEVLGGQAPSDYVSWFQHAFEICRNASPEILY